MKRPIVSLFLTLLLLATTFSLTVYGRGDFALEQEGTSAAQTLQALVDLRFTNTAQAVATLAAMQTATQQSQLTHTAEAALERTADALFAQALTGTASSYTATPSPSATPTLTQTHTPTITRTPTATRTPLPSPTAGVIPDDLEARLASAYADMLDGRVGAAIVAFERLAAEAPGWAEAHRAYAHAQLTGYRFADAEATLLEAIALGEDDASIYARLGDARFERRAYAAAVEGYEQALARNPYNVDTLIKLGDAAIEAGEFERSRQAFLNAVMIEPDNLSAMTGLAYILIDAPTARFDESALFGGVALALGYQDDGLYYTALGYYDLALEPAGFAPTPSGSAAAARSVGYQAQEDRLPVEVAYINRAILYHRYLLDSAAALTDVDAALSHNADFAPAYIVKARILHDRGDSVGARRELATAHRLAPDNPHVQRDYLAERQFTLFDAAPEDFYAYIRTQRDRVVAWPLQPSGAQLLPFVSPDWVYALAIPGKAGRRWRIRVDDAYETGVDPIIALIAPDGRPIAGDDDSGEGRNAELTSLVPRDGVYTLVIALIDTDSDGALQLSIEERQPDGRFTLLQTLTPTISPTPSRTRTPSPTPTATSAPDDVTAGVLDALDEGYRLLIDGSARLALGRFEQVVAAAPTWSQGYMAQAQAYYALSA